MIKTGQQISNRDPKPATGEMGQPAENGSPLLGFVAVLGLEGMLILAPVQFMTLPLNLAPVEIWNLLFLPIWWLYMVRTNRPIRLHYAIAMWFILLGSFLGTFGAPHPAGSLIAILKDTYLYVWFITVAAMFSSLDARNLKRVLWVWLGIEIIHGALVVAQFSSAQVFQSTADLAARFGALDPWRPSGLFENANSTALYQLLGFVPLFLVRPPRIIAWMCGLFLFVSLLATGSLASTGGFLIGAIITVVASSILGGELRTLLKILGGLVITLVLLIGMYYFVIAQNADLSAHFQATFYGRAQGSADSRFSLWERGLDFLSSETFIWGIGPDAYKDVDLLHKPLHNDLLAFIVERGVIGTLGLVLLGGLAVSKAIHLVRTHSRLSDPDGLVSIIFLAAIAAILVDAQFHQDFHHRSIWLVLAVQEAMLFRTVSPKPALARIQQLTMQRRRRTPSRRNRVSQG